MLGKHDDESQKTEIAIDVLVGALLIVFGTVLAVRHHGWWQLKNGLLSAVGAVVAVESYDLLAIGKDYLPRFNLPSRLRNSFVSFAATSIAVSASRPRSTSADFILSKRSLSFWFSCLSMAFFSNHQARRWDRAQICKPTLPWVACSRLRWRVPGGNWSIRCRNISLRGVGVSGWAPVSPGE